MIKSMKVKLHPSKEQEKKLFMAFGTARFAYNWALGRQIENYKSGNKFINDKDLRKEFTKLKKQEEYRWLYNVSNNITKQAIKDLCSAYISFFNGVSDKPRFKSRKHAKKSFYHDNLKLKFTKNKVQLEKIGKIALAERGRIPVGAHYHNAHISFDGVSYWISVGIDVEEKVLEKEQTQPVGLDLGVKKLVVTSSQELNDIINNFPKVDIRKDKKRLKRLQRRGSRYYRNIIENKTSKSKNLIKLERKINKTYQRIRNKQNNNIHQITSAIIKLNPKAVVIEDLNVKGMMKNKHLSEKIANCKFYEIRRQLVYKCNWNSVNLIIADRYYPSSKLCSNCGNKKDNLKLKDRVYCCEKCGSTIDRDYNAASNLKYLA